MNLISALMMPDKRLFKDDNLKDLHSSAIKPSNIGVLISFVVRGEGGGVMYVTALVLGRYPLGPRQHDSMLGRGAERRRIALGAA